MGIVKIQMFTQKQTGKPEHVEFERAWEGTYGEMSKKSVIVRENIKSEYHSGYVMFVACYF